MKNTVTYSKGSKKHRLKCLLWGAEKLGMTREEFKEIYLNKTPAKCFLRELKKECKTVPTTNEPFLTRIV